MGTAVSQTGASLKHVEHIEQVKFVQRVRHTRQNLLCFAVPNGGNRAYKEAVRLKAEGVLSGVPDLVVAQPTEKYSGLFLEFKTAKGRTSDNQKKVMAHLREVGYRCEIVRSCNEAWKTLLDYLGEDDA